MVHQYHQCANHTADHLHAADCRVSDVCHPILYNISCWNVFIIMKRRGNYLWSLHNFLNYIVSHKISCVNHILVPLNPSLFFYVSVCFGIYYSYRRNLLPSSWLGMWKQSFCIERAVKNNAVPLQSWSGPEGSRKLRFPDFMTTAQEGGKVVSLTHRPLLPPGNPPGTHFC